MNTNTEHFKLMDLKISSINIDEMGNYIIDVECNEEVYGITIPIYEGAYVTFYNAGCGRMSHIKSVYEILIELKRQMGYTLKQCVIEAKHGDVFYCRIQWDHPKKKSIFMASSIGDAIILSLITKGPLKITKFTLDSLEPDDHDDSMTANMDL